jgi:diacylglycerol kinase family enzyme
MKLLFVINPTSGGNSKEEWVTGIADYFKDSQDSYEWYEMQGQDDESSLKYWIDTYQPDRVVAVGGDGTLKFLAQNLLYSGMPIAFLPAGSANGMAKELGLPDGKPEAIAIAVEGASKKMDVIRINGEHISIHLSDLGLNAQLVKYFEQSNSRGMWGYVKEAFKVFWRKEKISLTIEVGGKKLERETWMLVVANARLYGTGVAINPEGSLYDGRFELVLLKRLSFLEILKMMLKNRPFNKHKVEVISAEQASIRTEAPAYFQVDGEYICECTNLECTIEKAAIDIVTNN